MFNVPALYQTHNYINDLNQTQLDDCREECSFREVSPNDEDIADLFTMIMNENDWSVPMSTEDCLKLYFDIRAEARNVLDI